MRIEITKEEGQYIRYGLNAIALGPADKETTFPDEYKKRRALHRRLIRLLLKAEMEQQ